MEFKQMNKIEVSGRFPIIVIVWLVTSIAIGWVAGFIFPSPQFFISVYGNYQGHVTDYEMLCRTMIASMSTMPIAAFFIWRYGFEIIVLRRGGVLIFSMMSMLGLLEGAGLISFEGTNRFSRLVREALELSDWLGAVVISFLGLYLFVVCGVILLKYRRSNRDG